MVAAAYIGDLILRKNMLSIRDADRYRSTPCTHRRPEGTFKKLVSSECIAPTTRRYYI